MTSRNLVQIYRRFGETSWLPTATVDVCRVAPSSQRHMRQPKVDQSNLQLEMNLIRNQHANGRCPMKRGHVDTKKQSTQQFSVNLTAISRYYPDFLRRIPKTRGNPFGSNLSRPPDNVRILQVTGAFGRGNFPHSHVNSPTPLPPPTPTQVAHIFSQSNIILLRMLHATKNGINTEIKAKFSS